MSGCSGAGKSTYVNKFMEVLLSNNITCGVCSADHYFEDAKGNYNFDHTKLGLAHQQCKDNCELLCQLGTNVVLIDNTSLCYKEISPYCAIAEKYKYKVSVIRINSTLSDEELSARNVHKVPIEVIQKMREKMEPIESISAKIYKTYGDILCDLEIGKFK